MSIISPALKKLLNEGRVWTASRSGTCGGDHRENHCGNHRGAVFERKANSDRMLCASFDIPEIDDSLPQRGLPFGSTHEFLLDDGLSSRTPYHWHPPLLVLGAILAHSLAANGRSSLSSEKELIAWVGRNCWPAPYLFEQTMKNNGPSAPSNVLLDRLKFLFLDPPAKAKRLWSTIQILSSPATYAVIADGSAFSMTASRKLQLAARRGNSLGLILRPPWESGLLSAASTKWKISPQAPLINNSQSQLPRFPQWEVELLRAKGGVSAKTWLIEWYKEDKHGKNCLRLSPPSGSQQ